MRTESDQIEAHTSASRKSRGGGRRLIANAHLFTLLFAPERLCDGFFLWCLVAFKCWPCCCVSLSDAGLWFWGVCRGDQLWWRKGCPCYQVTLTPLSLSCSHQSPAFTCCHSHGAITKLRVLWVWLISWIFPGCLVVN